MPDLTWEQITRDLVQTPLSLEAGLAFAMWKGRDGHAQAEA